MGDTPSRAQQLRNMDEDRVAIPADGYCLGATGDGELVFALDRAGSPQIGMFLNRDEASEFLDRFTAEMQEMGWLS